MFEQQDLAILSQEASWEKVDELGVTFFPKLGALKNKATDLIRTVYGIHANDLYKTYQAPTPSDKRRKGVKLKSDSCDQVTVSFRAKGKPSNLYKPDGTLCQMHFAHLGFGAAYFEDGIKLGEDSFTTFIVGVVFEPYILRYDKRHREDLYNAAKLYQLDKLVGDISENFLASHDFLCFSDLLLKDKMWVVANLVDLRDITVVDMAKLVINCVALFPVLDIFTRLSNNEKLYKQQGKKLLLSKNVSYREKFIEWYDKKACEYIESFYVEPITEEEYWRSEALVRATFEDLFGQEFKKTRPPWLKASKNKANMELDGYNQGLRLAFEYQGEHHYANIFPNQLPYEKIQENDRKKAEICKKNGVDLIQIPYTEKGSREYIVSKLHALERDDINQLLSLRN